MAKRRRKRKLKKWVKITIFLIIIVVVLIILCLLNRSKAVNSNIKSFVNTEKVSINKVMLSINDDSIFIFQSINFSNRISKIFQK